jgi:hypothetical protein
MIQRLTPLLGRRYRDAQIFFDLVLADVFVQPPRTQPPLGGAVLLPNVSRNQTINHIGPL